MKSTDECESFHEEYTWPQLGNSHAEVNGLLGKAEPNMTSMTISIDDTRGGIYSSKAERRKEIFVKVGGLCGSVDSARRYRA